MSQVADPKGFPTLFAHCNREDWGVSVLSGERDGKRRYLFEGGEERTMGAGALDLMRKVEHPDSGQRAAYARLVALLAKRERRTEPPAAPGALAVIRQLERFHKKYPGGFFSKEWKSDEATSYARRARGAPVSQAQEQFSKSALSKLVKAQRFDSIWNQVVVCTSESRLAPERFQVPAAAEQQRALGEATYELLHGAESYERRFDRFIGAYESAFREPPGWELGTLLSALVSPVEHVLVAPGLFRKQLKAMSRYSTFGARPNGAAYLRCLTMAKSLANMLAAHGEVPRDLLDVHDFMRETVTASGKSTDADALQT